MANLNQREPFECENTGFLERNKRTEALYKAEARVVKALGEAANEQLKVFERERKEYWTFGMTQAIYQVLEGIESRCVVGAAVRYLEKQGFKIEAPKSEAQQ
jgi:hypothetical protein